MKLIWILIITFLGLNVFAAKYEYKKYWSDSGLIRTSANSAFGVELKKSPLIPELTIAAVSYTNLNKTSKDQALKILKKAVDTKSWYVQKMDGLEVHEAFSRETGTFYRFAYNSENNNYSVASIAARYMLPTYLETHAIQLKHLKSKSNSKKFSNFFRYIVQNAYAQYSSENLPPINLNLPPGALENAVDQVGGRIDNLQTGLQNTVNNATSTVRDITSPSNVARTAAMAGLAFGVTNTVASMATNFLINGSMSMLRTLYYETSGELKPEEFERRIKRFESSMKTFSELSPKLNEIASKMAMASIEITLASGVTQEQYLSSIDNELEKARKAKTEASTDCSTCLSEILLKIDQLENLKKIVAATGNRTKDDLIRACQNMDQLYHDWVNTEYSMMNSRRLIMQDLMVFNGHIVNASQDETVLQEDRKKANSCKSKAEEIINNIKTEIDVEKCSATEDNMMLPICRRYFANLEILNNCDEMASTKLNDLQKIEMEEATARLSSSMLQFSKTLANMTCEKNKPGCTKDQFAQVRTEASETFKALSAQCPDRFFAQAMKKSSAVKPAVENKPPAKDERSFFKKIIDIVLNGSENPNKAVAKDPVMNNY